jgi:arylsulfatase A-like enzyme
MAKKYDGARRGRSTISQVKQFVCLVIICCLLLAFFRTASAQANETEAAVERASPNVVVIFIDDMGYGDIGPFGAKDIETPNLNKMAAAGMRFTDFQVSSAVCSASRAALLTGCYHVRVGIKGALFPYSKVGINSDEITLAEICKQKGYATACFGKWHLGDSPKFLPPNHGFDEYLGVPYSNDMWPLPSGIHRLKDVQGKFRGKHPFLPLIDGTSVVDENVTADDQAQLTTQYTDRAVKFIDKNKDKPFFLYVPHSMVHVPIYVSDKFKGKSKAGLYGDVVMELDWSVGQVNGALKRNGIEDNTLVVFTSDNGPWLNFGDHAGTAGPLREGKGTMWEGGCRVPTVMKWPRVIPAGTTCDELASTIDLLPTVAKQLGAKLPEHKIDGVDIIDLMKSPKTKSPHQYFYQYYGGGELHAVRDRRWKLHFAHPYRTMDGKPGGKGGVPARYRYTKLKQMELYDLKNDISESKNVINQNPDVLERLLAAAEDARKDLGDKMQERKGSGVRPPGRLGKDEPRLKLKHPTRNPEFNAAIKSDETKNDLKRYEVE